MACFVRVIVKGTLYCVYMYSSMEGTKMEEVHLSGEGRGREGEGGGGVV